MNKIGRVDVETGITHDWCMSDYDFFERIRKSGGWHEGNNCKFLAFRHQIESNGRPCSYFNYNIRNEMWTTVCSKKDYMNHIEGWYKNNLKNQRQNNQVSVN